MKKVVIIYSSEHAESIASAAIQALALRGRDMVIHDVNGGQTNLDFNEDYDIYPMIEGELPKLSGKHFICSPMKKNSPYYKRRLLLVWDKCFPDSVQPRILSLIGGGNIKESDKINSLALPFAIVALLGKLDLQTLSEWRRYLLLDVRNPKLLDELLIQGKAIKTYIDIVGGVESEENDNDVKAVLEANEQLSDDVIALDLELNWLKGKVSTAHLLHNCTPEEVKERYTVKELKAFCKENKIKGYSKLKEDGLVEAIHGFLKGE